MNIDRHRDDRSLSVDADVARALTGVLAAAATGRIPAPPRLGLPEEDFRSMLDSLFPEQHPCSGLPCASGGEAVADEFEDLVALLLAHRSHDGPRTEWLAYAIASACLGGDHLYQDMGLPDRTLLSSLLRRHFTALFDKNTHNMKWKKFFYKQLCDQAEVRSCRAPSCQVCIDYHHCFGPEEEQPGPDDTGCDATTAPANSRRIHPQE